MTMVETSEIPPKEIECDKCGRKYQYHCFIQMGIFAPRPGEPTDMYEEVVLRFGKSWFKLCTPCFLEAMGLKDRLC